MIQRYKMAPNQSMVTDPDGGWVEYTDHLAAVEEKDKEIERLQTNIDVMKRALRWSECEEDWDG